MAEVEAEETEVSYTEEDLEAGSGGGSGPGDDIRVAVKGFQQDADKFSYDIEVEVNGETKVIQRDYQDILWLHRWLTRRVELGGYILPPMPAPPTKAPDPKLLTLGECPRTLFGGLSRMPCMAMEVFFQTLADHRFFSVNHTVRSYLTSDQITGSHTDHLGRGSMWSHITKAFADYQLSGVQETDEEFAKFSKHLSEITPLLQTASQNFSQTVTSSQNLAIAMVSAVEAVKVLSTWEEEQEERHSGNAGCFSTLKGFAGALEEDKIFLHAATLDASHTLGFTFDLYHNVCLQVKQMLSRRLAKLQALLSATQQLDKAKPERKEVAEANKTDTEKSFNLITEAAREEIDLFKRQYVQSFRDALVGYTESQVAQSKRTYENLTAVRDSMLDTY